MIDRNGNRRLLFVVNDAGFFLSHRLPIAHAARSAGFDVHVATPDGPNAARIVSEGFAHHPIAMSRRGVNPVAEAGTLIALVGLMQRLRPDLVHLVAMKPVIYGGVAARLARVPAVVAAVAGLGYLREARSRTLRTATLPLLRFALNRENLRVIFQNPADRAALLAATPLRNDQAVLIRGSGIELDRYRALAEPAPPITATFASRLLMPKGVGEFVEAARLLRRRGHVYRFQLAGDIDEGNPVTVTADGLEAWRAEGDVEILGRRDDIPELFAASHIVCLPSYYGEGLPRVLLEAAACGRAVVTTDHPGCRDAVEAGVTGLLVSPRDPVALADAIEMLAEDKARRQAMGSAARKLAEREFGIDRVVHRHLDLYAELLSSVGRGWPRR